MLFSYEHKLLDIELSLANVRVTIKGQPLKFNDYEHFVRDKVENKKDFLQAGIILLSLDFSQPHLHNNYYVNWLELIHSY